MAPPYVCCPHCFLSQFKIADNLCRRCHQDVTLLVPKEASFLQPPATKKFRFDSLIRSGPWVERVMPLAIYYFRTKRGWSQREMADRTGMPRTYLSKVEQGRTCPTLSNLFRLAKAFEVEVSYIMLFCEEIASVASTPVSEEEAKDVGTNCEGFSLLCDPEVPA